MGKQDWHTIDLKKTEKLLKTDMEQGIAIKEVEARREIFGENKLPGERPLSSLKIFFSQFKSPLIYILIIAGVITLVFKEFTDSFVIFGAVFLNVIVGFVQERKASKTLSELRKMVRHKAKVLREGKLRIIDSTEVVPGDVVILEPGDKVPADGRLFQTEELMVNEMALTGEWLAARKNLEIFPKETPLADRDNMVYMGCVVESGRGRAIATETGVFTEIGKIAQMLRESKEAKTPYQRKLGHFSRVVGIIIAFLSILILVLGLISGKDFVEMFTVAVAIAVAAIPEGLPVAMTVILALGMQRILRKKGLVRRLASAETLGSTSIIATDKTATLTEGKMKVDEVFGDKTMALRVAFFTSEAFIEPSDDPEKRWVLRGRPTDRALLEAGMEELNLQILGRKDKDRVATLPFNSINKFAAALYKEEKGNILYVCGAPEIILDRCVLIDSEKESLSQKLEELAGAGLRVVASAYKPAQISKGNSSGQESQKLDLEAEVKDLSFAGFIALKDPVRKEVREAMKVCRQAGMRPIIVTGDHKLTARAVARELGFRIKEENILEGKDLDKLKDKEFDEILDRIRIYARVEPKHKLRIIKAWQNRGEVVAMTGDGINDAPALKRADIGVSIGSGTEVAKETSDLILLNDSFSIIVAAIEEGRAIIDNIRKVITYLLSDSFTEVMLIGVALLAKMPLPITAVQILWVNLAEDGLPDTALAFEPKEKDIMKRKPAGHKISLLTREMKVIIFIIGLITDVILLGLFFWLWKNNHDIGYIRTMIFAALSIDSLFYVFSCKSLRRNLWHINPFSNRFLVIAWVVGILMLVLAIYMPGLQMLLKTVPLGLFDWLIVIGLGLTELVLIEAAKHHFIVRHQTET